MQTILQEMRGKLETSQAQHAEMLRRAQDICIEAEDKADSMEKRADKAEHRAAKAEADLSEAKSDVKRLSNDLKVASSPCFEDIVCKHQEGSQCFYYLLSKVIDVNTSIPVDFIHSDTEICKARGVEKVWCEYDSNSKSGKLTSSCAAL